MDLAKLLAILNDRALFFASGKTLSKSDKLKGQPTYVEIDHLNYDRPSVSLKNVATVLGLPDPEMLVDFIALERQRQPSLATFIENSCFFNSWHMNDGESDAMWKIYAKNTGGVAVLSTVGRIKSAIHDPRPIFMGRVKYIDFDADSEVFDIFVRRFMRKSKAFSHEQEFRAILYDVHKLNNAGENVSVDPNRLIEKIVIAPTEEGWLRALVEAIIKKMGYSFPVVTSGATRVPPLTLLVPSTP